MSWDVTFSNKAFKQALLLNERVRLVLQVLVQDLKVYGPAPGKHWSNYGKLSVGRAEDVRHCHLIKGNPTYVCCWKVNKQEQLIEVYYVGTHEKAPY